MALLDSVLSVVDVLALLSENQSQFLRQRQSTKTDKEAYNILGQPGRSTLARWKKDETFKTAYDLILSHPEELESSQDVEDTLLTDSQAMESLALRQMVILSKQLPTIFQRLFKIATKPGRDQDSLRAIKQITDMFNIGPEMLTPEARSAIQEQIRKWTGKGE